MKRLLLILTGMVCTLVAFGQEALSANEIAGTDFYKAGKTAEATESFKKALAENPSSLYALNALGNLYLVQGMNQEAYEEAGKGIKLSKGGANFIITRAKAAIRLGKAAEAVTLIDGYLQQDPTDFMMLFLKGNALAALNDRQQALSFYSKSIAANVDFPDAYLRRGFIFAALERWPQAIKDYNQYMSKVTDDAEAYNLRGLAFYKSGMAEESLSDFNKSIELDPQKQYSYANRGIVYLDRKDNDKALADFDAALAIDPAYADAYCDKAILYDRQENYTLAMEMINKALALQPASSVYTGELSKLLLESGRSEEGLAAAEKVISLDPKNPDGYLFKMAALYNLERFDDALKSANEGIAAIPGNYLYYSTRASIYRKIGDNAAADADDAKAKELSTP